MSAKVIVTVVMLGSVHDQADGSMTVTTTGNDDQPWKLGLEKGRPVSILKGNPVNPSVVGLDARMSS